MVFDIVGREFDKLNKYNNIVQKLEEFGGKIDVSKKAFAQSGLTKGVYEYINSLGVASTEEMTFRQKLELSTIAIKEQAAAIWASPIGKAAIIAAGIFLVAFMNPRAKQQRKEMHRMEIKNKWNIQIILKGGAGSFGGQYETEARSSKDVAKELFCGPENSLQAIVDAATRQHRFFKLGEVAAFFISVDVPREVYV